MKKIMAIVLLSLFGTGIFAQDTKVEVKKNDDKIKLEKKPQKEKLRVHIKKNKRQHLHKKTLKVKTE